MLLSKDGALHFTHGSERVQIEAWGPNALRVRATKFHTLPAENWALATTPPATSPAVSIHSDHGAISNGSITAIISSRGKIIIRNANGERLLEESTRLEDPKDTSRMADAREFKSLPGGDYHLTYRLVSIHGEEEIFCMDQYRQPFLDLRATDLAMGRRPRPTVPFMLSNLGYGMLWNNRAKGRAVRGDRTLSFEALSTKALDYWIVASDTPAQIVEAYADVTATTPTTPEFGLGFWQRKLRYHNHDDLVDMARDCRSTDLPLGVIVVDCFHCTPNSSLWMPWASPRLRLTDMDTGPGHGEWKFESDSMSWKDLGESAMRRLLLTWKESSPASASAPETRASSPLPFRKLEFDPSAPPSLHTQPLVKTEQP